MDQILGLVGTLLDLALVILGFGFIVFIHELGHFLAARWAGIRVLAFALGFGTAALSYRKGMGWRRGSSEKEYLDLLRVQVEGIQKVDVNAISPTEYRLNWLPLGGYVKMLGQDDINPAAVSTASDSYQNCKPWKRMVVISAGVVMNLILAATLFVGVFMYGLKTEPAKVGGISPGSPASRAVLVSGTGSSGLTPGDVVSLINGNKPNSFNDLILATAMTERGGVLRLTVTHDGAAGESVYELRPEAGPITGLPEIGVEPARSNRVLSSRNAAEFDAGKAFLAKRGLPGVEPGMALVSLDGKTVKSAAEADAIVRASDGRTLEAVFTGDEGKRLTVQITPEAQLQVGRVAIGDKSFAAVQHLLGLSPVLKVAPASDPSMRKRQGLEDEDIFARLGAVEFPGASDGIAEIRSHKGRTIPVSVLRTGQDGSRTLVRLDPPPTVNRAGQIGFERSDTGEDSAMVALPPVKIVDTKHPEPGVAPAAASIIKRPGTVILAIGERKVANLSGVRAALLEATRGVAGSATVKVTLAGPSTSEAAASSQETVDWVLSSDDVASLRALSWTSNLDSGIFEPEQFVLKAKSPVDALNMGLSETKRVMMSTYITFARLFQGTVKVEHLKGPVGIAHLGTRIAEKGTIWLLFFMALISVNLAVINFLPLPVVDGGQFLFLLVEQIRGKPVPVAIQNVATLAGLLLIGTVFVIVTFHDIANLF